mgnify:CR=1 FL=1
MRIPTNDNVIMQEDPGVIEVVILVVVGDDLLSTGNTMMRAFIPVRIMIVIFFESMTLTLKKESLVGRRTRQHEETKIVSISNTVVV